MLVECTVLDDVIMTLILGLKERGFLFLGVLMIIVSVEMVQLYASLVTLNVAFLYIVFEC